MDWWGSFSFNENGLLPFIRPQNLLMCDTPTDFAHIRNRTLKQKHCSLISAQTQRRSVPVRRDSKAGPSTHGFERRCGKPSLPTLVSCSPGGTKKGVLALEGRLCLDSVCLFTGALGALGPLLSRRKEGGWEGVCFQLQGKCSVKRMRPGAGPKHPRSSRW